MDIEALRQDINAIDRELVELFQRRMHTAHAIAEYKKEHDLPIYDRKREREVIHRITGEVSPELATYAKALYTTLFELSKTHQNTVMREPSETVENIRRALSTTPPLFPSRAVVACQGTEGAYSQSACEKLFKTPAITYVDTFEGVFEAVERGSCDFGVLPVENSTAGSVTAVYELMQKHKFHIVASTKLCVEHCLMGKKGTRLEDVREVFSHEQALRQCSTFLASLKGVKQTVYPNTAMAAEHLFSSQRTDAAVICSADCAELYNLERIASSVANTDNNYTRFICISKQLQIYPGADRTSMIARLPHKPGALYQMISRFVALDVNLVKLESRPVKGSDFEFMFFFDVDSSIHSEQLLELLAQLEHDLPEFVYLGSYHEC